jgi:hypothetical protein
LRIAPLQQWEILSRRLQVCHKKTADVWAAGAKEEAQCHDS